ncbi:hypothetical protein Hypma_009435 [Hypsizygus marmoreus]|uniref:Uncharacterized protein n=1 Tax=Hypsizygus marmoreus TaxID=39966 RepID=A0A369JQ76_HYPMA|nr:hypothetical protein Hypma_009435 [Hypsizygus marmoreus]
MRPSSAISSTDTPYTKDSSSPQVKLPSPRGALKIYALHSAFSVREASGWDWNQSAATTHGASPVNSLANSSQRRLSCSYYTDKSILSGVSQRQLQTIMDTWTPSAPAIPPSPNLNALEDVFSQLLAAGVTHASVEKHLFNYMIERAKTLPPTKVLRNDSHRYWFKMNPDMHQYILSTIPASVGLDPDDTSYRSHRSDPAVFAAITEYGRRASFELPKVADVMRAGKALGLQNVLTSGCWDVPTSDAELRSRAKAFLAAKENDNDTSYSPSRGWHDAPDLTPFKEYVVQNPDTWTNFGGFGLWERNELEFAQVLLKEDYNKYYAPTDMETEAGRERERAVYERIGIACCGPTIGVGEVPAGVAYRFKHIEGLEDVEYGEETQY